MRAAVVALSLFVSTSSACGSADRDRKEEKPPPKADASTLAPTDAELAVAFIERAGADSRAEVDWVRVAHSRALVTLVELADLSGGDLAALGDGASPWREMIAALGEADFAAEAKHAAEAFTTEWEGASGCRAASGQPGAFLKLPKDSLEGLPKHLMETGMQLMALPEVRITCGKQVGAVVFGADGRVIALRVPEDPAALQRELEAGGNRFADHVNEPME